MRQYPLIELVKSINIGSENLLGCSSLNARLGSFLVVREGFFWCCCSGWEPTDLVLSLEEREEPIVNDSAVGDSRRLKLQLV